MVVNDLHSVSRPQGSFSCWDRSVFPPWVEDQLKTVVRQLRSARPGGTFRRAPFNSADYDLQIVDRALSRLAELDPQLLEILECRAFRGLSNRETALVMGISTSGVQRDWRRAKLWFYRYLQREVTISISAPC